MNLHGSQCAEEMKQVKVGGGGGATLHRALREDPSEEVTLPES